MKYKKPLTILPMTVTKEGLSSSLLTLICLSILPSPLSFHTFSLSLLFFLRLLRDDRSFTFVPRSRQDLPDNFPKEIPGHCYFLEAGKSQSHSSLTSSRSAPPAPIRRVSYNIGTMFLRETSL